MVQGGATSRWYLPGCRIIYAFLNYQRLMMSVPLAQGHYDSSFLESAL